MPFFPGKITTVSPKKGVLFFIKRKIFQPSIVGQNALVGCDSYAVGFQARPPLIFYLFPPKNFLKKLMIPPL
jgi:hypothetical protein